MSTQPPTQPPSDQLWRWDGQNWQPAPRKPYWSVGKILIAAGALLTTAFVSCVSGAAIAGLSKPAVSSSQSGAVAASSAPNATPAPTPTAAPAPKATPVALSGQGSKVIEVDLPRGSYRLSWTTQGHDNFIVHLEGADTSGLVNEIPPNPSSGETFVRLGGGHYALNIKASTLNWSMTFTPL